MNSKHRKTLKAVFQDPVRADIIWAEVESMLVGMDADIEEGAGSRVRIELNGVRAVFHRPHPQKEAKKGVIRVLRVFLSEAGVKQP